MKFLPLYSRQAAEIPAAIAESADALYKLHTALSIEVSMAQSHRHRRSRTAREAAWSQLHASVPVRAWGSRRLLPTQDALAHRISAEDGQGSDGAQNQCRVSSGHLQSMECPG